MMTTTSKLMKNKWRKRRLVPSRLVPSRLGPSRLVKSKLAKRRAKANGLVASRLTINKSMAKLRVLRELHPWMDLGSQRDM